jgi:hypothetical protein
MSGELLAGPGEAGKMPGGSLAGAGGSRKIAGGSFAGAGGEGKIPGEAFAGAGKLSAGLFRGRPGGGATGRRGFLAAGHQ